MMYANIEVVNMIVIIFAHCAVCIPASHQGGVSKVIFGKLLHGQTLRTLWHLSLRQCHNECMWRKTCKSYNYIRSTHLCELNIADKDDASSDYSEFTKAVYGQKIDWEATAIRPACSSCEDRENCEGLEDEPFGCFIWECPFPPPVYSGAKALGKLNHVGAKVRYVCTSGAMIVGDPVSECNKTGNWSLPGFKCVPDRCLKPNIDTRFQIINVTTDVTPALLHIRCIGNFITRGSPLRCGDDGKYNYKFACCDTPDESQWMEIYKINSGGNVGAKTLLFDENTLNTKKGCQFRRIDIITNWSNINISRVKIQLRVENVIKAWITFDGRGSTISNWFSQSRLIDTSWQDLSNSTENVTISIHFSTKVATSKVRFPVIQSFSDYNCSQISGWMVLINIHYCLTFVGYPAILFAPGSTKAATIAEFQVADSMEIAVELAD